MNNSFRSKAKTVVNVIKQAAPGLQGLGQRIKDAAAAVCGQVRNLFHVKPQSLGDYYSLFGLLVAKKLAIILLFVVGIGSAAYLFRAMPAQPILKGDSQLTQAPVFRYSSPALKQYSGQAQILARKRELVYSGDIVWGKAKGRGLLYNREGALVYAGEFSDNCYNGKGTAYYPEGGIQYSGEFASNVYQGQGLFYGESGVRQYEGQFENGLRNGQGTLFSSYGNPIYQGNFYMGEPDFRSFLGGKAQTLSHSFTGRQAAYLDQQLTLSSMTDFQLLYEIYVEDGAAFEESSVSRVYYVGHKPAVGDAKMTAKELDAAMDELYYKGDTLVTAGEYAALDELKALGNPAFSGRYQYRFDSMFSDVKLLTARGSGQLMYIRSYSFGSYFYTFYFSSPEEPYVFYSVEQLTK